jgi:2-(1,2-epoxy-1,2-dihydrophenyl)acetyl-CoA isomerase
MTESADPSLLISRSGPVLTLTLNRPEHLNAFDRAMAARLVEELHRAGDDDEIRAVIVTGAGRAFTAGQDVNELSEGTREGGAAAIGAQMRESLNPIVLALREVEKPVIAAVNGYTTGAGIGVALACDIRIASDNAIFAMAPFGIAFIPGVGTTALLPAIVGLGRATELTFNAARIDAARALAIGMVSRIVEPEKLMTEAQKRADSLAALPTKTIGFTKRAFNRAVLPNFAEQLEFEASLQTLVGDTDDHREGLQAVLEKRRPTFTGR